MHYSCLACPICFILLHLVTKITFGKEYKLLCKFINPTVPPSLRSPHILTSTLFTKIERPSSHTQTEKKCEVILKNHNLRLSASSCFILRIFSKGKRVLIQETSRVASAECCSTLEIFFFLIKEFHHLQTH
jgi:hypothetical protein